MNTCRLRNKGIIILWISLLIGLFVFILCQNYLKDDIVDGNFTKPIINVNGYIYGASTSVSGDLTENYTYYGNVKSITKEMIEVPSIDLEVSKIIEDNVGYKVYISQDKNFVAIFNEKMQKYNYFEKIE